MEGVIGRKPLALGSNEEGVVAADKAEPVSSQNSDVAQGHRQLYGVVGFERMVLGQIGCGLKIGCGQRNNSITMCELADESTIFSVPLRQLDPTYALNDT